jgi:microcystin-dependent protein
MADTVTPNLGLTKPEIGASNNTWGNKVNGNFDILDNKVVYNNAQWKITLGDNIPASGAGPFMVTRYGNDGIRIDDPFTIDRQSGFAIFAQGYNLVARSTGVPPTPPPNNVTIWTDANANLIATRADGSSVYVGVPPGVITWTAASTPDSGWMLCQGQSLSRSAYPVLFSRIGTNFGSVDGTSFNLPDIRGRVIAAVDAGANRLVNVFNGTFGATGGADNHYLSQSQIPTHTHGVSVNGTTGDDSPDHTHSYSVGVATNVIQSINTFPAHTALTGATTGGANVRHKHPFGWSGDTDNGAYGGAGLGSSWHPNVQPTIVLNAQVKLG